MIPTDPLANAIGKNTAIKTSVIPMIGLVISFIAFEVASTGDSPSVAIIRSTFSMTTIASSTMIPIAKTIPNMVKTLIEKPLISMTANVPNSAIGATIEGINV
ncbi:hypothetical protein D3C80_586490 [compost metagenome]